MESTQGREADRVGDGSLVERVLREAFEDGRVQNPNGAYRRVTANISREHSRALSRFVEQEKPGLVIEIGMAYAISTLSILRALEKNGSGRLISIDPYIGWRNGRRVALHQVERAGVGGLHSHLHESSHAALPRLLAEEVRPELVYIDGNHNFDYVFTDFFYADKLIGPGGVIAFNDAGWRSVFRVICFLQRYRRYEEVDVGLSRKWDSRNRVFSLIKRLEGRSGADRYFRKREDWEPDHGFYRSF